METLYFIFDPKKSTQALNYFAIQQGGQINKMKALKLIFLADRYHLRKYGRLVTNDNYVAMQHGPVPSATKDIAESNDYLDDAIKCYSREFIKPVGNLRLKSIKDVDDSILSESDLEALQFAWDKFGDLTQFELRDLTHFYPEWSKFKDILKVQSWMPMDLLDFLNDPPPELNKCFELNAEDKSIRKEQLTELAATESLWR
ncbi:MAG: SocA family protein [Chloroflexi bacterium]|nr:SocA family protein [Chloroflexota bacterium]